MVSNCGTLIWFDVSDKESGPHPTNGKVNGTRCTLCRLWSKLAAMNGFATVTKGLHMNTNFTGNLRVLIRILHSPVTSVFYFLRFDFIISIPSSAILTCFHLISDDVINQQAHIHTRLLRSTLCTSTPDDSSHFCHPDNDRILLCRPAKQSIVRLV